MKKDSCNKTSLWERLKICYHVLTKHNYIYFGLGKDSCIFKEDGSYDCLRRNKHACFIHARDEETYSIDMAEFFIKCSRDYLTQILEEKV